MLKKIILLLAITLAVFSPAMGLSAKETSHKPKLKPPEPVVRKPIVIKLTTIGGLRYYLSGLQIDGRASMEKIILPLNDPEANRLLKVSKDAESSGVFFLVAGLPFAVGGLIWGGAAYNNGVNTDAGGEAAGIVIALLGLAGEYVGIFKIEESETSEFAAVQRYNAVVHGDDETAWNRSRTFAQTDLLRLNF